MEREILGNMIDLSKLRSPEEIPVGTILVQHWLNSTSLYRVIGTSKKSVLLVSMPTKQTHFDHDGGGTGRSYKLPDEDFYEKINKAYKEVNDKYGFDVILSKKVPEVLRKNPIFWDDYAHIVDRYFEAKKSYGKTCRKRRILYPRYSSRFILRTLSSLGRKRSF